MTRPLLPLVVVIALAGGCPEARPEPLEPIRVGVLNPISGALSSLGPAWENAARLAAEQVNAGGGVFDGRPLELVFADSATDRATAISAAKDLVDQGVVGLVGPATSGESGGVLAEVAKPNQVPMISCCATSTELTQGNAPNAGFFFRTTPSDALQGKALAFLAKEGFAGNTVVAPPCPRAAFIHRNDSYGDGFKTVFEAEYVGPDGAFIAPPLSYGTPDAEASLAELQQTAADAVADIDANLVDDADNGELCIVVISFDNDGAEVINNVDDRLADLIATKKGASPAFDLSYHFLVGDGANSSSFAAKVGPVGTRILGTVPFHSANDDEAYVEFAKTYRTRFGEEPIAFTAQNYDAVFVMALAITQAKSTVGKDIRNKLFSVSGANGGQIFKGKFFGEIAAAVLKGDDVDYAGPSGEVTFDAFGDVVGDYVLWQVEDDAIVEREPLPAAVFN
jgi:branched-chain amino acid transport system substrate-binding protein